MATETKNVLMFVARQEDMPRIRGKLRKLKETGRCEFCNEKVIFNRDNYKEQKSKGYNPVLICTHCYGEGAHIRQGYR